MYGKEGVLPGDYDQDRDYLGQRAGEILNVRLEVAKRQGPLGDFVDAVARILAGPLFFTVLLGSHIAWVILNLPWMPWQPWDPYPFVFLATVASAEAPFIALLILMYQHRQERINELRDELALQINLHIERKASLSLRMLEDLYREMGRTHDHEGLDRLKQDLDVRELMEQIREELDEAEGEEDNEL